MIVFLDSGVLGLLSSPRESGEATDCKEWFFRLLSRSVYIVTSDICDYEVRRGLILSLLREPSVNGLKNLDSLTDWIEFLPLTRKLMKEAAQVWAEARSQGIPTASDKNIDGDIIIAAQWRLLKEEYPGREVVIATTNLKHLQRFTDADTWRNIR